MIFDHHEIKSIFGELFSSLLGESDRGAVLIGSAYVDEHLTKLFEGIAPSTWGKKKRDSLLKYPGCLSTFASKVEIAHFTRLISQELYDSINSLRRIRNEVAHESASFRLCDHLNRVHEMYKLGKNVPAGINRMALEMLMKIKVDAVLSVKDPDNGQPYFNTPQEAIEYFAETPELLKIFDDQLPRYEFAVAIALICAWIIWQRDSAKEILGNNGILSQCIKKST